jgi:hypothetical protein
MNMKEVMFVCVYVRMYTGGLAAVCFTSKTYLCAVNMHPRSQYGVCIHTYVYTYGIQELNCVILYYQSIYLGALVLDYQSVCVYVYVCIYVCMYGQTVYLGRCALILHYLSSSLSTSRRSWSFRLVLPHVPRATTTLLDLGASLVRSAFIVCIYICICGAYVASLIW